MPGLDNLANFELLEFVDNIAWIEGSLYVEFASPNYAVQVRYTANYGRFFGGLAAECLGQTIAEVYALSGEPPHFMVFYESLRFLEHNRRRYYAEMDETRKNFNCLDKVLYGLGEYF